MRVGQNPAKFIDNVVQPKQFTVAVLTYIPFIGGYYSQGLELLKVCLESIWEHTDLPYDLLVFDNASCPEALDYLWAAAERGQIQYLILSERNIGKGGAWNIIFGGAPGEFVAYADSDTYFYPGWLSALYQVYETFPQAGMVTGMPLLNPETYSTSTMEWAHSHPQAQLRRGKFLSWEDYWRHAGTLGNDQDSARAYYERHDALLLEYQGKQYYVGAGHFQFLAPRRVLQEALPIPSERPMGEVRALDIAINRLGYLRLCTPQWWVEHLGNTLDGWQPYEHRFVSPQVKIQQRGNRGGIWAWKPVRRLLTKIHHKTFDYLYKG